MSSVIENNKRIARNTIYLYIRLLFSVFVSLYTSRVVLATLGQDDFGLNAVITSVVTIFLFINVSMSGATSRFLIFELGKKNHKKLKKTFSAALTVHLFIAIIILLLGETIGLWYLENRMIIPEGRLTATRLVYQLSLVNALLTITQVPYNASIIAHEKMNVYAYIEISKTLLLLGVVYLLMIGDFDKLILYAFLTLCVTLIITLTYRIYCVKHFKECKYKFDLDKNVILPMLSFSGWNVFANASNSIKAQGINIILNLFFITSVNAAYSIAAQVNAAITNLSSYFTLASKPQLIKYYAENKIKEMEYLMINISKFSLILLASFCFTVMFEIDFVLTVWLKNTPPYTETLCVLYLIITLFSPFQFIMNSIIHATGKIKEISLKFSLINLLTPILTYLYFRFIGGIVYVPLLIYIVALIIKNSMLLIIIHQYIPTFSILNYIKNVFPVCSLIIILAIALPLFVHFSMDEGWMRFLSVTCLTIIMMIIFTYRFAFNKMTRSKIIAMLSKKINRR